MSAAVAHTGPRGPQRRRVLIVGGRATGIAAVVHLVDTLPSGSEIVVADPEDTDYPAVFDDDDPLLVANSSPQINSLFPNAPDDFIDFLRASSPAAPVSEVTPRMMVGRYCRTRYERARRVADRNGVEVRKVVGRCESVTGRADGYAAVISDGARVEATDVVVAVGVGGVREVGGFSGIPPFPSRNLRGRRPGNVLIVGQGQSAIDAALVLCDEGNHVVMTSRSGYFPAVRTRTHPFPVRLGTIEAPADLYALTDRDTRGKGHPPLSAQLCHTADPVERLRQETLLAAVDACPWQDSIIGILDVLCERAVPLARDRTFVWRYVTAIALSTARRLLRHVEDGQIVLRPLAGVVPGDFDLVVTATGFDPPPMYHDGRTLYLTGRAGRAGSAPQLTPDLRLVLDRGARRAERIWAIGPSSGSRVPFANFFRGATRQAQSVARQIGALAGQAERRSR